MGYFLCYISSVVLHINHIRKKEQKRTDIDVDFS